MSTFKDFNCAVKVSGQSAKKVFAIWEVSIDTATPGYGVNDPLSWSGGSGIHISDGNFRLRLIRTSGDDPEVGDTITGTTGTANVTAIATQDANGIPINPPNFDVDDRQNKVEAGHVFRIIAQGALEHYGVVSSVTVLPDIFELAEDWPGVEMLDFPAAVSQDADSVSGVELPSQADPIPIAIVRRAITQLLAWIGGSGDTWNAATFAGTFANHTGKGGYSVAYRKDAQGFVHVRGHAQNTIEPTKPATIFTLPANYRPTAKVFFMVDGQGDATTNHNRVSVDSSGNVAIEEGLVLAAGGGWVALDEVSFRAEA